LLCVLSGRVLSRRADHSSRGVLPTLARCCLWSRNLVNETIAIARWAAERERNRERKREREKEGEKERERKRERERGREREREREKYIIICNILFLRDSFSQEYMYKIPCTKDKVYLPIIIIIIIIIITLLCVIYQLNCTVFMYVTRISRYI
jgi:hypothetical protein